MRPLEIVLVAVEAVALVSFLFPRTGRLRWLRHGPGAVLPAMVAQVVVEGPRWQLVVAYALGVIVVLAWMVSGFRQRRRPRARVVGVVAGLVGLAVAASPAVLVPVFTFPQPTGPHAVGTLLYHWVDHSRAEVFTPDPDDRRELMVQVWYPAEDDAGDDHAAYVPDADTLAPLSRLLGLPSFALGHLRHVETNAIAGAPMATGNERYPLLILASGRGGYRQYNTLGVEELVSHGYVVASIDPPYANAAVRFPDGRVATFDERMLDAAFVDEVVPFLADDTRFVLDQLARLDRADPKGTLTGRIDLEHAGVFGLSLGGEVTAQACANDVRFRACLVMDSWATAPVVDSGLRQPTMWVTRDAATMREEGWSRADIDRTLGTMRSLFTRLPADGYIVQVPGMFHTDFADAQLLSPLTRPLGITGPIDGRLAHRVIDGYTRAFFDRHLKHRPAPLLDGATSVHRGVHFETRR